MALVPGFGMEAKNEAGASAGGEEMLLRGSNKAVTAEVAAGEAGRGHPGRWGG